MRAEIRKLEENLYLIDDAGESTAYLLCGERQAALIDTLNGVEDLKEIVSSLTDLPVTVINTHGHCDHIAGNIFFDEAWIHPADEGLAGEHFTIMQEVLRPWSKSPCPFRFMEIGQVFDLGGLTLEVVSLKGHTAGSVGLLCREKRLFFTGDGLNPHIWMQLRESRKIEVLYSELKRVKEKYGAQCAFDKEEDLLALDEIECVYIASPVFCHKKQAELAANHAEGAYGTNCFRIGGLGQHQLF